MICANCKRKVPEQAAYCPYCGAALSAAVAAKRKRRSKKGLVVLPVCLLLCLVALGVFWCLDEQDVQAQSYIGTEKGTALTDEEAESILLSDISDEDWEIFEASVEEISQIIAAYSDEDGYVDPDDTEAALNAVAEQVDALYEDGTVAYYVCDSDMISFEFASGLTAYFEPALEGYLAGSGTEYAVNILTADVYTEELGTFAQESGTYIDDALSNQIMQNFYDKELTVEQLMEMPESEFFLWYGHGDKGLIGNKSYLVTRQITWTSNAKLLVTEVAGCITEVGLYWAITPKFIENYISMNNGLAYINACYSGINDKMANAFLSVGAETVFVNVGEKPTNEFYAGVMMKGILYYMSGAEEEHGIMYTAQEALDMTNEEAHQAAENNGGITMGDSGVHYDSWEAFIEGVQGDTHVELRGEGKYTLCSCIRGEVIFAEGMTEDEVAEVLSSGLTVQLTKEDGSSLVTVDVNEDGTFYFNDLEPETTYVVSSLEIAEQSVTVSVKAHRYTEVSLEYSKLVTLEGYVYDTDGAPLSGVTVSAEDVTGGSDLRSAETRTDDNGYYALKVYGENTYALTYSKSGYTEQETRFQITPELFEQAQEGTPCTLEDVELSLEELPSWKEIYGEYVQKIADDDIGGWSEHTYALVYVDNDDVPELYVGGVSEAEGDRICTIDSSGSVVECWLNRMGGAAYIERSGMFYNYNGNNGILTLNFYSLADGVFTESNLSGESVTTYDEESDDFITTYKWEGKSVSEEVFYANWNSVMARDRATSFYAVSVSASELLDLLAGNDDIGGADLTVYTSVVQQYENTYGTIGYNIYYQNQETRTGEAYMLTGLCLVQPIDFDGDSVYELLIGYGETVDASTGQTEVCGDVWGLDGDTPVLLYSGASFPGESYYNAIAYKSEGGVCYLYDGYSENRFAHVDIYGLEDGSFTKVYALEADFSSDSPHYTLNGTAISITEYAGYVSDGLTEFYAQVSRLEDFETCRVNLEEIYDEMDLQ